MWVSTQNWIFAIKTLNVVVFLNDIPFAKKDEFSDFQLPNVKLFGVIFPKVELQ